MTNLLGFPRSSVVSATIAAMTAPTKPTPMTTTTSLPSARAACASFSRRASSAAYSAGSGRGKRSPAGLTEYSGTALDYCRRRTAVNGNRPGAPPARRDTRRRRRHAGGMAAWAWVVLATGIATAALAAEVPGGGPAAASDADRIVAKAEMVAALPADRDHEFPLELES